MLCCRSCAYDDYRVILSRPALVVSAGVRAAMIACAGKRDSCLLGALALCFIITGFMCLLLFVVLFRYVLRHDSLRGHVAVVRPEPRDVYALDAVRPKGPLRRLLVALQDRVRRLARRSPERG